MVCFERTLSRFGVGVFMGARVRKPFIGFCGHTPPPPGFPPSLVRHNGGGVVVRALPPVCCHKLLSWKDFWKRI